MEQSPEEIGDLYLDVGEAYLEQGRYASAQPLLSALIVSEKYNLAVVWLRHAGKTLKCLCTSVYSVEKFMNDGWKSSQLIVLNDLQE